MTSKGTSGPSLLPAFEQLTALLSWRGQDGQGPARARDGLASAHAFANDIQGIYQRAATRQLETMLETNERMAGLLTQLAGNKEPEKLFGLQIEVAASLSQAGLASVTAWAELSQQLAQRCGELGAQAAALPPKIEPATRK